MDIDRKFIIHASCVAHHDVYTEKESVLFLAKDAAFNRRVLDIYKEEALRLGANDRQIRGIDLLIERVERYKTENPHLVKVPDIDSGIEEQIVNRPNDEE